MPEDKILERVRLLLARAEHPNTPGPEAELAMQQANKLINKHAIEEAMLEMGMSSEDKKRPESRVVKVGHDSAGEFWPQMRTILQQIAATNRCRGVVEFDTVTLFGFHQDLAWTEMLYTTVLHDFVSKVNPRWDESKPFAENVYNFKVAGYKWADINELAMRHGHPTHENLKDHRVVVGWDNDHELGRRPIFDTVTEGTGYYHKLKRIYTKHAKEVGDEVLVKTTSFQQYREQFTMAFTQRLLERLEEMRRSNENDVKSTTGAELALVDRSKLVDEAMWEEFPELHPDEVRRRRELFRQQQEQELREREEMLAKMTPKQRVAFLEKEERERRRSAKRGVRYVRYQSAAADRGKSAANTVDLSRKRHTSGAAAPKPIR